MGINNPIPRSLKSETKKAAKVLSSFVKPNQVFGADQVIPPDVLRRAKGLAIVTVLKAGFLFSGRAGSGVIVARLPDGSWSAPSAIAMAGGGAGGMVGIELTDFVFILNTKQAVKSFSEFGTITLGGNVSVSAGPLGRSAEYAASASTKAVASVFAYSKSKGLFAGVSVEGSAFIERREANRKFYGDKCTTKMILSGRIRPPPHADPLFRVLESRAFNYRQRGYDDDYDERRDRDYDTDSFYNDIPDSFSSNDDYDYDPRGGSRSRAGSRARGGYDDFDNSDSDDYYGSRNSRSNVAGSRYGRNDGYGSDSDDYDRNSTRDYYAENRRTPANRTSSYGRPSSSRTNTRWEDEIYDNENNVDDVSNRFSRARISSNNNSANRERRASRSSYNDGVSHAGPKAVALYTFSGEESGDLSFKKGDVIAILKKSDSQDDWWTGRVNGKEGIFPANYVELV
ncbi:hypothetical protein TPHA_0O01280 [Tetrapisispora phaffii CBS 4417]|uniref:SH3 domain-containing protein n=1 Tax=Tetrapisispora phaffii (strain ATCC 24235 / CBS 4417 / NBRC 1672 / NRRL Y-8282 / UCD 70-5) TaxID=1071381 RepID=G8C1R8_TETPH|nr:hypothetical protein TPHA_0O01280 [Tetrapisispora phaffii CBS 4417]CCE66096.1 hypothetical protein TPHA_0O01280 [Tetrapisispora phaffii CBS 4417]